MAQVAEARPGYAAARPRTGEPATLLVDPAASQLPPAPSNARPAMANSATFSTPPGVFTADATPVSAIAVDASGQPGSQQLEGPQSPQLTIQKFPPPA